MKSPSKNVSKSLRGQKTPGLMGGEGIEVSGLKKGSSMTVPGEGGVEVAPGMQTSGRQERSAVNYATPCDRVK
jgi:hypothetical protein